MRTAMTSRIIAPLSNVMQTQHDRQAWLEAVAIIEVFRDVTLQQLCFIATRIYQSADFNNVPGRLFT